MPLTCNSVWSGLLDSHWGCIHLPSDLGHCEDRTNFRSQMVTALWKRYNRRLESCCWLVRPGFRWHARRLEYGGTGQPPPVAKQLYQISGWCTRMKASSIFRPATGELWLNYLDECLKEKVIKKFTKVLKSKRKKVLLSASESNRFAKQISQ